MELPVKVIRSGAKLPERGTKQSAGMDLYAAISEPVHLPAKSRAVIPTGIAVQLMPDTVGLVFGRSGLGIKHGIAPSNAVGVIDADYRGEILVGLYNSSDTPYTIQPQERIAQLVVVPVIMCEPVETEILDDTARGEKGFGSTGRE